MGLEPTLLGSTEEGTRRGLEEVGDAVERDWGGGTFEVADLKPGGA